MLSSFPSYAIDGDARSISGGEQTRCGRGALSWPAGLLAICAGGALLLAGCTAKTEPRGIEEAFVSRDKVELVEKLGPHSTVAATLEMETRVEIIGRRRRFVRVRTPAGLEGWTRDSELITPDVRRQLDQLRRQTDRDPSQGAVRALGALNVHLEPYRWSPTIDQLEEEKAAEILRHRLVERLPSEPQEGKPPPQPEGLDDWYLVRLAGGRVGWVLTSGVYAAIPVEVAQYAERKRITSYFALGEVADPQRGEPKTTWLWTQISRGNQPYDFDLIRVFRWSRSRHAYQTIKIERGLVGYLPVETYPALETEYGAGTGFSITVDKSGRRVRRNYVLVNQRVHLVGEEPAQPPPPLIEFEKKAPAPPPSPNLMERLFSRWKTDSPNDL